MRMKIEDAMRFIATMDRRRFLAGSTALAGAAALPVTAAHAATTVNWVGWQGYDAEGLMRLFLDPEYPVLNQLLDFFGPAEVRKRIDAACSGFDAFSVRTVIDETPDPVKLETAFGSYSTSSSLADGKLVFTRALTMKSATLPVSEYGSVRQFFEKVRAAEQAPVVLVRT